MHAVGDCKPPDQDQM
ncbi:hypothetical protein A2U01_0060293, partial [Trifolium medium]|nr:hypothetical protein [Trifolium medium]